MGWGRAEGYIRFDRFSYTLSVTWSFTSIVEQLNKIANAMCKFRALKNVMLRLRFTEPKHP